MASKDVGKVFTPEKKHTRKKRNRIIVVAAVLLLIFLGIGLFLILKSRFSVQEALTSVSKSLFLQGTPEEKTNTSFVEEAKGKIDKKVLNIVSTSPSESYVEVKTKEGITIFLSSEKSLSEQVRTLQTLLSKAKIDMREILVVDFRFEKLAVQYK